VYAKENASNLRWNASRSIDQYDPRLYDLSDVLATINGSSTQCEIFTHSSAPMLCKKLILSILCEIIPQKDTRILITIIMHGRKSMHLAVN